VTVDVAADNDAPTADDDTGATDEDTDATGTLTAHDPDEDDALSYGVTSQPVHGSATIDGSGAWTYTPANRTADYGAIFTVTVTDGGGNGDTATVTVAVVADNDAPSADAGTDQSADTYTSVRLDGGASHDPEGGPLTFGWTQTGGAPVILSSASISQPTFTTPGEPTVIRLTLVVTDALGLVDATPDEVVIHVSDGDADGDGIPDSVEGDDDPDGDGTPSYLDDDSDGDGIPDSDEGSGDTDGDGTSDFLDDDSDGDGIPDCDEGSCDTDGDGAPDFLDDDSDGDGIPDSDEGSEDTDGDGIPDRLEPNDKDSDGDGIPDHLDDDGDAFYGLGPGGVGTIGIQSRLMLWLRADAGPDARASGDLVAGWHDQSGKDNHAFSTGDPSLEDDPGRAMNDHPVISFDGDDSFTIAEGPAALAHWGDYTLFAVGRVTEWTGGADVVVKSDHHVSGPTQYQLSLSPPDGGSESVYTTVGGNGGQGTRITSAPAFDVGRASLWSLRVESAQDTEVTFYDGGVEAGFGTAPGATPNADSALSIGTSSFRGDIAEVAIFCQALNAARRTLVENSLSARYDVPIGNDRYDGDRGARGDFDRDVAGIGREADGSHKEAHSAEMILQDRGFLRDDGDYLLIGHRVDDNGATDEGCPAGVTRWRRVWYLDWTDQEGNGGPVTVAFDVSEAGLEGAPGGTYTLLKRADAAQGPFVALTDYAPTVDGDRVIFQDVDVADLGSGLTLGRSRWCLYLPLLFDRSGPP
jgi:VCBS repeat-containing protein